MQIATGQPSRESKRGSLQQTQGDSPVLGDHLTEREVTELRALVRKLLERNGAWQNARCAPL
jgi:hypothetical protein